MLGRLRDVLLRLVVLVEKAARLHELGSLAFAQALHEAGAELFQGEVVLQIFSRVRHARALLRQIGRHSSERLAVCGGPRLCQARGLQQILFCLCSFGSGDPQEVARAVRKGPQHALGEVAVEGHGILRLRLARSLPTLLYSSGALLHGVGRRPRS